MGVFSPSKISLRTPNNILERYLLSILATLHFAESPQLVTRGSNPLASKKPVTPVNGAKPGQIELNSTLQGGSSFLCSQVL